MSSDGNLAPHTLRHDESTTGTSCGALRLNQELSGKAERGFQRSIAAVQLVAPEMLRGEPKVPFTHFLSPHHTYE